MTRGKRLSISPCALALSAIAVAALSLPARGQHEPGLDVELVASGLRAPLDLTFAPDGSGRRFIVDQNGFVQILLSDGTILPEPFLDIQDRVELSSAFDERGLLALAFHPDFASNGKLYVHYSGPREGPNICLDEAGHVPAAPEDCPFQHTRRISEFTVSHADANFVDPATERILLTIQWPGRKHNGGGLAFGPEGLLYVGLGDGGWIHGADGGGSPFDVPEPLLFGDSVAQNLSLLYGKILRIDVDHDDFPSDPDRNYGIPAGNPLISMPDMPDEIFAWGFRNPFRIAFDDHGDQAMYVSATAETFFESIYRVVGPGNYGWATKEGTHNIVRSSANAPPEVIACADRGECPVGPQESFCVDGACAGKDFGPLGEPIQDPVVEYLNFSVEDDDAQYPGKGFGRATVGGRIYRGNEIPWLRGQLVAGDFAINTFDGQILIATPRATGLWDLRRAHVFDADDPDRAGFMKSIGVDADGELYAITGNSSPTGLEGKVWKVVDAGPPERRVQPAETSDAPDGRAAERQPVP